MQDDPIDPNETPAGDQPGTGGGAARNAAGDQPGTGGGAAAARTIDNLKAGDQPGTGGGIKPADPIDPGEIQP
jgi:hypothetical protein